MKRKLKISTCILTILLLFSCDYKKTQVVNKVNEDGSITRTVMVETNSKDNLEFSNIDVPVDSTWEIEIRMEIQEDAAENEKKDTIWYLTAEKHFASVAEINLAYQSDSGANRELKRSADFSKSFRWFTTVYRYSEKVDKVLQIDCPISDFLSREELDFIYLPDKIQESLKNGPDSLAYKELVDSVETKSERWFWVSSIRQWIEVFYELFGNDPNLTISKDEMLAKELQLAAILTYGFGSEEGKEKEKQQDSIFVAAFGEKFYSSFKTEIDSTSSVVDQFDNPVWSASDYNVEIRLPGRITASNGYAETGDEYKGDKGILWTVSGVYFLTQDYEMWAESRVNNYWIWALTAVFILFVFAGFLRFLKKRQNQ